MRDARNLKLKDLAPIVLMAAFFPLIYFTALLITQPVESAGIKAFKEPSNPTNIIILITILLVVTLIILLIARYWKKQLIQIFIIGAAGLTSVYLFYPLFLIFVDWFLAILISLVIATIIITLLLKYPEWYVIDVCGFIIAAGATAIFGISLTIPLVITLLIILAIYDALAVYKTKHMIDLADSVMDLKLPVLLVIPKTKKYSFIRETKRLKEKIEKKERRDAFFMGLGDIVMPGILVVSAYRFIPNGLPIAIATIVGILIGFTILMGFVIKGKPQAGLPFLNGGAIAGYLVSSFILFGGLVGFSL
jgi:presenilin-like A22 family membrane protease